MASYCQGEGQPIRFEAGSVHPLCSVCGRDLSVQGEHKRTEWNAEQRIYVAKRHKADG